MPGLSLTWKRNGISWKNKPCHFPPISAAQSVVNASKESSNKNPTFLHPLHAPYLTLIGPWLKQSALLDHLAAVVDAGSLVVAVDGHSPGVGAARVLTHDSPGPQEQQMS